MNKESEAAAWHEAGHAIVSQSIGLDVLQVTLEVTPHGCQGGTVCDICTSDNTKSIIGCIGGLAGEYLYYMRNIRKMPKRIDRSKLSKGCEHDLDKLKVLDDDKLDQCMQLAITIIQRHKPIYMQTVNTLLSDHQISGTTIKQAIQADGVF